MRLTNTIPALPVQEIQTAVAFYRDRLGFAVGHHDAGFGIVSRDDVELHLWAADDASWRERPSTTRERPIVSGAESFLAGTASCRIEVEDIDELYREYRENQVLYAPDTTVEQRPWGTREFPAMDLERNLLTFFERNH